MPPLRVDDEIFERYPHYRALVVHADGLRGGPSDEASTLALRRAHDAVRRLFERTQPTEHPHIAAWRAAYRDFGSKPSRFRCSAEALIRRALAGGVPPIDRIVDVYNAVSLEHVIPVGGEDRHFLVGEGRLRFATGDEPFDTLEDGRSSPHAAPPFVRLVLSPSECHRQYAPRRTGRHGGMKDRDGLSQGGLSVNALDQLVNGSPPPVAAQDRPDPEPW